jgi:hypothetical protein
VFGRRKQDDEDPFAALHDGGQYSSTPITPDLGGEQPPSAPSPRAPATARTQRRPGRIRRQTIRLLITPIVFLVVVVAGIGVSHRSGPQSATSISIPALSITPTTQPAATDASGAKPVSYLSESGGSRPGCDASKRWCRAPA